MKILGWDLYERFIAEQDSPRMVELINGAEYGNGRKWQGLVHDTDVSLIANYVYYWFQNSNALQTVGTSTKASKSEAGTSESPADKMIAAWQFFASETRDMISFLWNRTETATEAKTYPEFGFNQYSKTLSLARKGGVNKLGI